MTLKVEGHPELERDEYSKGITNIDNDAYTKYMKGALARKQRNSSLEQNTKETNAVSLLCYIYDTSSSVMHIYCAWIGNRTSNIWLYGDSEQRT